MSEQSLIGDVWQIVTVSTSSLQLHVHRVDTRTSAFDLWYCRVQDVPEEIFDAPANCPWLQNDDDRWRRFRFLRDRHLHVTTRLLVRAVLSQYSSATPVDWRFERTKAGQPHIASDQADALGVADLRFNLSHSESITVCAVCRTGQIGVDIESLHRNVNIASLSKIVLTPEEQAFIIDTPEPEKTAAFLRYWTLKEAYLKALGLGLAIDPNMLRFTPQSERPAQLLSAPNQQDAAQWHFTEFFLEESFVGAIAHSPL